MIPMRDLMPMFLLMEVVQLKKNLISLNVFKILAGGTGIVGCFRIEAPWPWSLEECGSKLLDP